VSHAQGWRQQFQKLESVDLRYDNQIIVNPDMAKPAASRLSAAKAAAAAGVKPVSLLTRMGPNERPIPKPAFELTAKKLDPKPPAGSAKKVVNKPKVSKVANVATNSTTTERKPASAAKPWTSKGATKRSVPVSARRIAERKKVPGRPPGASAKSASRGQKPSPAIAKTQASSEPSD
jgi:hypothetical protein